MSGRAFLLLAVLVAVGLWKTQGPDGSERIAVVRRPQGVMGTSCSLAAVVAGRDEAEPRADAALREAESVLRGIEARMSTWLADSEVSRLNAAGPDRRVPLSPDTLEVLRTAKAAQRETGGAFDTTCRPLVELWRQAVQRGVVPKDEDLAAARAASSWQRLELGDDSAVKLAAGVQVDLGGIAKGYAVDRAAAVLRRAGLEGGMVDVGGDLVCFGRPPQGQLWTVDLKNPFGAGVIAKLHIGDGAVCTSGNYARPRVIAGRSYSHIIDPTTGRAADAAPSVTVLARNAVTADIWATALSVLGPAGFERLPEGVDALMIVGTPSHYEMLSTPGFRDRLERPLPERLVTVVSTSRSGPVLLVDLNDFRLPGSGFLVGHRAVGDDDDPIAGHGESGGGAIQEDGSGSGRSFDGVGDEALGVVEVEDVDLFAGQDLGGVEQVPVDGDAALVIQIGAGEGGTVDFGLEHEPLHATSPSSEGF